MGALPVPVGQPFLRALPNVRPNPFTAVPSGTSLFLPPRPPTSIPLPPRTPPLNFGALGGFFKGLSILGAGLLALDLIGQGGAYQWRDNLINQINGGNSNLKNGAPPFRGGQSVGVSYYVYVEVTYTSGNKAVSAGINVWSPDITLDQLISAGQVIGYTGAITGVTLVRISASQWRYRINGINSNAIFNASTSENIPVSAAIKQIKRADGQPDTGGDISGPVSGENNNQGFTPPDTFQPFVDLGFQGVADTLGLGKQPVAPPPQPKKDVPPTVVPFTRPKPKKDVPPTVVPFTRPKPKTNPTPTPQPQEPVVVPPPTPIETPTKSPEEAPRKAPVKPTAPKFPPAPVKDPTKEPLRDPTKTPIVDPTRDPNKTPIVDPTRDPNKTPIADPPQDPAKNPDKKVAPVTVPVTSPTPNVFNTTSITYLQNTTLQQTVNNYNQTIQNITVIQTNQQRDKCCPPEFSTVAVKRFLNCQNGAARFRTELVSVLKGTEEQNRKLFEAIANTEALQCIDCDCDCVAAVPEWWQIRPEGKRPQMVLQFCEKFANGKYGAPKYAITIPHPIAVAKISSYPLNKYKKGNFEGELKLADNSKVIINCISKVEAERVLSIIRGTIRSDLLRGSSIKLSERRGKPIEQKEVFLRIATYFRNGIENASDFTWKSKFNLP
ncbi:hypothetical protein [Pseudanabaena mucicola]|uniref:Uncharacterized protein n=1 Tax=Pseudanabaena mucicola FACHB-723 TaxID=2692860 RepID=A0ABR8A1Y0_9CYAN|nr:hypothetical protein [Pseudanabaena mucicola]MBD2189770.1 hypothetical protein [Pseudanabaena mucicola FACHB-723]